MLSPGKAEITSPRQNNTQPQRTSLKRLKDQHTIRAVERPQVEHLVGAGVAPQRHMTGSKWRPLRVASEPKVETAETLDFGERTKEVLRTLSSTQRDPEWPKRECM